MISPPSHHHEQAPTPGKPGRRAHPPARSGSRHVPKSSPASLLACRADTNTEGVFHQLDSALRSLLLGAVAEKTEISFDTPQALWAERVRRTPTINAYLHYVCEDTQARAGSWIERRDTNGRVVAREAPPRQYRVCYMLTAWAADTEREHALLGAALAALAAQETIQPPHLPQNLAESGFPVTITVADPNSPRVGPEIWSALGIPPRGALDLVLGTALVPWLVTELAPPARRIELGVTDAVRPPEGTDAAREMPETQVHERMGATNPRRHPGAATAGRPVRD